MRQDEPYSEPEARHGSAGARPSGGGLGAISGPPGRQSNEAELKQKTRDTARKLFHSLKSGVGYEQWKRFDKGLARDLSMFFTGTLYSREVISQAQRELCAVASLTVLNRSNELRAHIHAALTVGATRQQVAEVIFQQVTYGGMPVVVEALDVYAKVLAERGEPFPAEDGGR
jgi:4-carboxymuconolactone decarboxylase